MWRVTERRRGDTAPLLSLAVAILVIATASCRSSRRGSEPEVEPGTVLADRLVSQLERRIDIRHLWLAVAPIERTPRSTVPRRNSERTWVTEDRTLDRARTQRIHEKIVEVMAARVHVVDLPGDLPPIAMAEAEAGTINAVLVARFDPAEDDCIRVRTRILDRRTREILAVSEATME